MSDCRLAMVTKVESSKLTLKYSRTSACADCHSKESCSLDQRDEEFTLSYNEKDESYNVGDIVEISLDTKQKWKALLFAYVYPLIILFLLAIFLSSFHVRETILALVLLFSVIFYYVLLYFCRHKLKKSLTPQIRKVS